MKMISLKAAKPRGQQNRRKSHKKKKKAPPQSGISTSCQCPQCNKTHGSIIEIFSDLKAHKQRPQPHIINKWMMIMDTRACDPSFGSYSPSLCLVIVSVTPELHVLHTAMLVWWGIRAGVGLKNQWTKTPRQQSGH